MNKILQETFKIYQKALIEVAKLYGTTTQATQKKRAQQKLLLPNTIMHQWSSFAVYEYTVLYLSRYVNLT